MGKEFEKEQIYVYIYFNHFAVHLKPTQYCKLIIFLDKTKIKENIFK